MSTANLTVIISSYKYGHLVANAIDSVLAQRVQPKRIIVVDDGADDGTIEIAQRYGLEWIKRNKNLGIINNYNDLLYNQVKTEKMMILAADDWIRPDYIEKMNLDADIVSCDIALVGEAADKVRKGCRTECKDGFWIWRFYPERHNIMAQNYIHGSSIYRVEPARKFGYHSLRSERVKKLQEDWVLFRSMIKDGCSHIHIKEPLLFYRKHRFNLNGLY